MVLHILTVEPYARWAHGINKDKEINVRRTHTLLLSTFNYIKINNPALTSSSASFTLGSNLGTLSTADHTRPETNFTNLPGKMKLTTGMLLIFIVFVRHFVNESQVESGRTFTFRNLGPYNWRIFEMERCDL